jgi:hypothetical protein
VLLCQLHRREAVNQRKHDELNASSADSWINSIGFNKSGKKNGKSMRVIEMS